MIFDDSQDGCLLAAPTVPRHPLSRFALHIFRTVPVAGFYMKRVKFTTDQQLASAHRNHFTLIGFFSCGIRNDDAGSAAMAGSPWPAISMLCLPALPRPGS
jgi:hypothetical protein